MKAIRLGMAMAIGVTAALMAPMVIAAVSAPMASVVQADRVTPRVSESGEARVVPMTQGKWAYLGEFVLQPGVQRTPEQRSEEEYLYVLSGSAILAVDGERYFVGPRMGVYLPAGVDVQWSNGGERLVAVQFFAGPAAGTQYNDWMPEENDEVWPRPRRMPRPPPSGVSLR